MRVEHASFEEWWEPYTLGVGRAGDYVAGLDPERRAELRERCRAKLPPAPFAVDARAWCARARCVTGPAQRPGREATGFRDLPDRNRR